MPIQKVLQTANFLLRGNELKRIKRSRRCSRLTKMNILKIPLVRKKMEVMRKHLLLVSNL